MYKQVNDKIIQRLSDGVFIPVDDRNSDYLAFKEWQNAGNTPEPASNEVVVPSEVTMRQARLALLNIGKLASVDVFINSMFDPPRTAARIEWDYSNVVQRHNGFVAQIAPSLGMSEADLDQLFIAASKL